MTLQKVYKSISLLLILGIFGWTLYYIVSYDDYYYGEPLNRLEVVIKDRPKFIFDGDSKISYYYFTAQKYKTQFRISEGAVELVRNSDSLTRMVEAIQRSDSISLEIRQKDGQKLSAGLEKIRVIGLWVNGKKIFDPTEVKATDKSDKMDRWFGYCVFFGILLYIVVRGYFKHRSRKRSFNSAESAGP